VKISTKAARYFAIFMTLLAVGCGADKETVKSDVRSEKKTEIPEKKAEIRENKTDEDKAFLEYSLIFQQLLEKDRSVSELAEKIYPKIIKEYKDFVKKYPRSRLVDDAKLRIAEFYNIWGTAGEGDFMKRKLNVPENWRKEAATWLLDIVENHSDAKAVSYPGPEESKEFTAAHALYFLYAWDRPQDKKYLEILVQKYPESEVAGWARDILKSP